MRSPSSKRTLFPFLRGSAVREAQPQPQNDQFLDTEDEIDLFLRELENEGSAGASSGKKRLFGKSLHPAAFLRRHKAFLTALTAGLSIAFCALLVLLYFVPVYTKGTRAEQRILAESEARAEDMDRRLDAIDSYLRQLNESMPEGGAPGYYASTGSAGLQGNAGLGQGTAGAGTAANTALSEEELAQMQETLSSFETDLTTYRDENPVEDSDVADKLSSLLDELAQTRESVESLRAPDSGLTDTEIAARLTALQEQLSRISGDRSDLLTAIDRVHSDVSSLSSDLSADGTKNYDDLAALLKSSNDELGRQLLSSLSASESSFLGQSREIAASVSQSSAAVSAGIEALSQQQAAASGSISELSSSIGGVSGSLSGMQGSLDGLGGNLYALQDTVSALTGRTQELEDQVADLLEKTETGNGELQLALQEQNAAMESLSSVQSQQTESLISGQTAQQSEEFSQLRQQLSDISVQLAELRDLIPGGQGGGESGGDDPYVPDTPVSDEPAPEEPVTP
ncbi:MAG: hypothetical protein J5969_03405 [Lachnospiraceae bacterium]|nr:hypothetical protein [Lachnospiraceae bacterium]